MRRLARLGWAALGGSAPQQPGAASASASAAAALARRRATTATGSAAASSTSSSAAGGSAAAEAVWTPFSAVMFIPSAVCGCLAYWQYERMQWKDKLIRARESVASSDPVDIFTLDEPADYDKVSVTGRMLHEYSLYVGPRPRSIGGQGIQSGYLLITPMVSADRKGVVLVNRGWVPASWKAEAQAAAAVVIREREATEVAAKAQAAATEVTAASAKGVAASSSSATASGGGGRSWWGWGRGSGGGDKAAAVATPPNKPAAARTEAVTVVGVIQPDEQANQFMPKNELDTDEFHYIQREAMATTLGLPPDTPLVMVVTTDAAASVPTQQRSPLDESRNAGLDDGPASASPYPSPKHVGDLVRFTTMPGDHLNYAAIWVTLCVVLAFMGRTAVTKPLRGPRIVGEHGEARAAWKASQAS